MLNGISLLTSNEPSCCRTKKLVRRHWLSGLQPYPTMWISSHHCVQLPLWCIAQLHNCSCGKNPLFTLFWLLKEKTMVPCHSTYVKQKAEDLCAPFGPLSLKQAIWSLVFFLASWVIRFLFSLGEEKEMSGRVRDESSHLGFGLLAGTTWTQV